MLENICVAEGWSVFDCDVVLNVSNSRDLLIFFPELWLWLTTSTMSTTCFGTVLDKLSCTDLLGIDVKVGPCLSSLTCFHPHDLDLPLKYGILPQTFSKWFSCPHLLQTLPIAGQSDLACLLWPHPKHWLQLSFPWVFWLEHEHDWDHCLWSSLFCIVLFCVPGFFLPWWHFLK